MKGTRARQQSYGMFPDVKQFAFAGIGADPRYSQVRGCFLYRASPLRNAPFVEDFNRLTADQGLKKFKWRYFHCLSFSIAR
jgi:hypothetical protein